MMKNNRKTKFIMIMSGVILVLIIFIAVYKGTGVTVFSKTPPDIYIRAGYNKVSGKGEHSNIKGSEAKEAILGTYSWSFMNTHIESDSDHPMNFEYKKSNIIYVEPGQKLTINTQKTKLSRKYNFTEQYISILKDKQEYKSEVLESKIERGNLYITVPSEPGEYVFMLVLNFKNRGTASYGFVVRAGMVYYDLAEISKYKTPYVGDHAKIGSIASLLPVPDKNFKQQYISLETSQRPYGLTIYYEAASDIEYKDEWPLTSTNGEIVSTLKMNALVAFSMIDNVDNITFAFRNSQSDGKLDRSKYESTFTFDRAEFEEQYGDLSILAENLELLQEILDGKKSAIKGLELYVWRNPDLTGNNNIYYTLLTGTDRNKTKSEVYNFNIATSELEDIKKDLSTYRSGTHLSVMHSMNIDKATMEKIGDELIDCLKNASMGIGGFDFETELDDDPPMPEFSDTEVEAARSVVEEYFRAVAAKDAEAILATMYPREHRTIDRVKSGNVQLYGDETRTLLTIDYFSQDRTRRNYRPGNLQITAESIIVFRVSFEIKYPLKDGKKVGGPWNEGVYEDWNMILIRDDENSPWLIYDQGY
ncbi:MAG: DUF4825 domain-containing protein [Clostridiaceae bacterium]|nr:DUF4825 domain-containing protein [Clostridiaceae bacterium]